ncbi:MAG TPA: alpha/beta fold hydrolase [Vicinamibacterales bacterium]|nr:alpha/beta fold hydrolase [Vicinamibacterales bacterium]
MKHHRLLASTAIALALAASASLRGDDGQRLLTVDHYVKTTSTAPAIAGQPAQIYVRERVQAGTALRAASLADRVVLFVHGAGTPSEVSFDVPYQDYSWMAYLAGAGFDVFGMDMTGYGRSTRPPAMNDPCNLAKERQAGFAPAPCPASPQHALTTMASDWDDINAAVDYIRALRHVDRVSLVAWSQGGPRAGGYTAQHPEKVNKLVLLAPAYNRNTPAAAPAKMPPDGVPFNTQSRAEFFANWDRQVGCPDQYDRAAAESVWSEMLASDPVGATWGSGVRRAPSVPTWGWTPAAVGKTTTPTLLVAGAHDKQVNPERVRELFSDLASTQKVFVDLACASHNAAWERNHLLLYKASLEWLTSTSVNGAKQGVVKLGYPSPTTSQ